MKAKKPRMRITAEYPANIVDLVVTLLRANQKTKDALYRILKLSLIRFLIRSLKPILVLRFH